MSDVLASIEKAHPGFLEGALDAIDEDAAYKTLKTVADVPAPSQTASMTRGRVMEELLEKKGLLSDGVSYARNAFDSGCDVLERGAGGIRFVAHMDEISYIVSGGGRDGVWPLTAFCYHLADGPRRARATRYSAKSGYHVAAEGEIRNEGGLCFLSEDGGDLQPGDRVVLNYPIERDGSGSRVTGHIDNAAGVACVLLASEILCRAGIPFSAVFTDEEEGPAGKSSQTIARGAARVYPHLGPAALDVVIDVHGLSDEELRNADSHRLSWGASLAEFSSHARGSVTPPHIYATVKDVAETLSEHDVSVRQNVGGYVSRSDDVAVMMRSARVAILGYPGINRHFDSGLAAANLTDLRDLSIALAVLGAAVLVTEPEE